MPHTEDNPCRCQAYKFPHRPCSGACGEKKEWERYYAERNLRTDEQRKLHDSGMSERDFI